MKLIAPDYYEDFSCIAGRCRHSCCIGWEIDIDPETLQKYSSVSGAWGERLRKSICLEGETAHFCLERGERCPFLKCDGLCELILNFGKESLCQICTDHPRFRHFYSDRTKIGLGLCCEEACRLTLSRKESVRLIALAEDAEGEKTNPQEQMFFAWRDTVLQHAQNRDCPMEKRIRRISRMGQMNLSEIAWDSWYALLMKLERMDERWASALQRLREPVRTLDSQWEIPFEQLLVYLVLRHLPSGFETGDLRGYLGFVLLMWKLLCQMFTGGSMEELIDLVRLYSSEIEYSDENVEKIIDEWYRTAFDD